MRNITQSIEPKPDLDSFNEIPDSRLGSLIFQIDSMGVAEHVGIITSIDKQGQIWITHAVTMPYNRLIETLPMEDVDYEIFTPTNSTYRFNILKLATHWGGYKNP